MGERKSDEFVATGTHRAWIGEDARPGPSVRAGAEHGEAQRNWLNRQPRSTRHGAITRSLYSWSNYKSWTEKMKTAWVKDAKDKDPDGSGSK
jgi:hypothetical protein